jgi:hypothetical protein
MKETSPERRVVSPRQLGQLDVGDGADVEGVGAGDVAGAPCWVESGVLAGACV